MAVRNILKTDSIPSLIHKEKRGEYRGYRRELLTEETHKELKKFIFCSQCEGISRKPRLAEGKTFCSSCYKGTHIPVDSRLDEIVLQLKSRCPLSSRGCDWLGQLGDIEQHMGVCEKLRIDCVTGCGEVLERCETDKHLKECPLRREQCEFCGEEVQASKANGHISLCARHPDGEVLCPYKELGCDVLRIQRKDLDTHLTDNIMVHQKLLLREIHQLRSENDRLRNTSERKECENSKKLLYLKRRDVITHKRVWMLLSLAVLGVAVLISYFSTERDRIDDTILFNKQSIQSNEQSIRLNTQSSQSHVQSMRFLMSNAFSDATYLFDYIQDRGKTLQGVEWTHGNVGGETYYGPVFYVGTCKFRLHVYVSATDGRRDADYYVTRLEGDFDDLSDTCYISYIHLYRLNKRDNSRYNVRNLNVFAKLNVGDKYWVNRSFYVYVDITLSIRTIRIYFDIE